MADMRVLAVHFSDEVDLQVIGDILYRYSPQIALRAGRTLFLEVSRSHRLYTEEGIGWRTRVHLQRLGWKGVMAFADDAPTALAFAERMLLEGSETWGSKKTPGLQGARSSWVKQDLPIESLRHYASPFRADPVLEKACWQIIGHLKNLGLRRVGDFQKISSSHLLSRFGALGRLLFQNVEEARRLVWPPFVPSEKLVEAFEFDIEYPVESTEPMIFQIRSMVDRIYWRLRGRGQRLKKIRLTLELEHRAQDGSKNYILELTLTSGIITPKSIFQILREHLQRSVQVRPLTRRVQGLSLEVLESTPYRESQRDLLNPQLEEQEESYTQLLSRLRIRLGESAVFWAQLHPSYLPEFNWRRGSSVSQASVPSDTHEKLQNSLTLIPRRPLCVWPVPERLAWHQGFLFWRQQRIDPQSLQNPEIVFSEWWNGVSERAYFCVPLARGPELWIFRSGKEYFLHGIFD